MEQHVMECGCRFNKTNIGGKFLLEIPIETLWEDINLECPRVAELLATGQSKGVFQLESPLGRSWVKKLKPENLEHMAALVALLRPGCVSCDTKIMMKQYDRVGRKYASKYMTIKELHDKFTANHYNYNGGIVSLDEQGKELFNNDIDNVIYSGKKDVYRPIFKTRQRRMLNIDKDYSLECTADHKLLVHGKGWIELKHIRVGDRVAVLNRRPTITREKKNAKGEKAFRDICFYHYEYKCTHCDWNEGSLDVNHIDGNRKTNNHHENLCFMCPNHHRMFSEGKISKEDVLSRRERLKLPVSKHVVWAEYLGNRYVGKKDTYDIKVVGPNHNFIAGDVVVHNCLEAKDEKGVSMTEHYCRRKNKQEEVTLYNPEVDKILSPTYQVLAYQEQAIMLAARVAGFDLQQADNLRKAMGKKLPEEMAKVKIMFIDGAVLAGILNAEQAAEVFGWIEKSQRYSFNKSHAMSYGKIGWLTAYLKSHFTIEFFTSWLYFAVNKGDAYAEMRELIEDAKLFDVSVMPPDITMMEPNFTTDREHKIWFGLGDIKGIGEAQITKLIKTVEQAESLLQKKFAEMNWFEMMKYVFDHLNSSAVEKFIQSGALSGVVKMPRKKMLAEWDAWGRLTDKERGFIVKCDATDLIGGLSRCGFTKKEGGGAANKKRVEVIQGTRKLLENPPSVLEDDSMWVVWHESQLLGTPLTANILDGKDADWAANCTCRDIHDGISGPIAVATELKKVREIKVKNGKNIGRKFAFLSLGDNTCTIDDAVMWSESYDKYKDLLVEGNTVMAYGQLDKKTSAFSVTKVVQI